jgi:hypothetical protein
MKCRLSWTVALLLGAAYVIVCVQLAAISYGDYPDHLARAVVIHDLLFHGGEHFGTVFQFRMMPLPYVLGDLLLVGAIELFGVNGATAVWTAVNLLALPLAVMLYLKVTRTALHSRALFFIVCLYLSTDWFFLCGFLNFHLAIAMVIFTLALAQSLRGRWSAAVYIAYAIMIALGYLMHLAFVVFLGAALGTTALWRLWKRVSTLRREVELFSPILLVLAWHAIGGKVFPDATEIVPAHFIWGSISSKLRRLDWDLVRLNELLDVLLALTIVACLIIASRRRITMEAVTHPAVVEMFVLTITFIALYFALPIRYGDPTYLDVRALALAGPFAAFMLLLLFDVGSAEHKRTGGFLCAALAVLAIGNLIYLGSGLTRQDKWLADYRALTKAVPSRANVLPIFTRAKEGQWRPSLHAAALSVVIDRNAIIPDMFSGDRGSPMKYFRYINRAYTPPNDWYTASPPVDIDWHAVACSYEFILITRPFDPQRIRIATTVAAQNSSGALLTIDQQQCRSAVSPPR